MARWLRSHALWDYGYRWKARLEPVIPLVLYLVSMGLTAAVFLPNLSDINPWDEASYIYGGWRLVNGGAAPKLANSPLIFLLYGLAAIPFRESPFWFVHAASLGRFLLISLMWLAAFLVGKRLRPLASGSLLLGFMFVLPFTIGMIRFPSDPLFAAMAGLSLWQLLGFQQDRDRRHLVWASLFMGLAAFSRNDGLISFLILILITVILTIREGELWRSLLAISTPFIILVGGYLLVYGAFTGDYDPGTMQRTYDSFEAGYEVMSRPTGDLNPTIEAHLQAREVYGTPEENEFSVFQAISKNPQAWWRQLLRALEGVPRRVWYVYGSQRYAALVFLFALRGLGEIILRKRYMLSFILILWPMHLASSLVTTFFRDGYFLFDYYVMLALAGVGLMEALSAAQDARERVLWTVAMLGLVGIGWRQGSLPMIFDGLAFTGILWATAGLQRLNPQDGTLSVTLGLAAVLVAGMVVRAGVPGWKERVLGEEPEEKALLALYNHFDRRQAVAAAAPGPVWAADKTYLGLASMDVPIHRSPERFLQWLVDEKAVAVYVDEALMERNPTIWEKLHPFIGEELQVLFESVDGRIMVLAVEGNPSGQGNGGG